MGEPERREASSEDIEQAERMRRKVLEAALTELTGPPSKKRTLNVLYGVAWAQAELVGMTAKGYAEALLLLYTVSDQAQEFLFARMAPAGTEPALKGSTTPLEEKGDG